MANSQVGCISKRFRCCWFPKLYRARSKIADDIIATVVRNIFNSIFVISYWFPDYFIEEFWLKQGESRMGRQRAASHGFFCIEPRHSVFIYIGGNRKFRCSYLLR